MNFKKTFTLHDKNGLRFDITAEIKTSNGKDIFSIRGSHSGGVGQCQNSIAPKDEIQRELLRIWDKYHLNDMQANCEHQKEESSVYRATMDEYYTLVDGEEKQSLIKKNTCKVCGHIWGSSWNYLGLPNNFSEHLNSLIDLIKFDEEERNAIGGLAELMEEAGLDDAEACQAYLDATSATDLMDFEEAYSGRYSSDKEFAKNLAEELGLIDKNAHWPNNCIDWEFAVRELMYDYCESNGYYFRNL